MSIEVRGLVKRFGGRAAVDGVELKVDTGELVALIGPSGSGKSTLLRLIAGLEAPDGGRIILSGEESTSVHVRDRAVGFVFQHYALFRHMTVADNVAFGLSVRRHPPAEIAARVAELLRLVQLEGFGGRYPAQLSGGQRQRVALARALAPHPKVLLLDEPFGALDARIRDELGGWVRRLHEEHRTTTLFVTHDQHEALQIADRIAVINKGRVEQDGSPLDVYDRPATHFVAQFVGESNFISTVTEADGLAVWGPLRFTVTGHPAGTRIRIYFRPSDLYVTSARETLQVEATITRSRFRGPVVELALDLGMDRELLAHVPKGIALASGFAVGGRVFAGITGFTVLREASSTG